MATGPADVAERRNGWPLAEVHGDADPYGIPYLLNRVRWSVTEARTALCGYVQDPLGDPRVVGIIDETTFLKQGPPCGRDGAAVPRHGGAGTARSGSSWPTRERGAARCRMRNATCRRAEPTSRRGGRRGAGPGRGRHGP